nr:reverse transcriptase domain-containing protein [Tanacetum cinerariifolium]
MVKALLLDKKSQNQSPAPVKAVEESCVTCGGAHSYHNCPASDGNNYRDNIQKFVSQAFAVNYNQGNTSYRPLMMSNQIRPPSFPPVCSSCETKARTLLLQSLPEDQMADFHHLDDAREIWLIVKASIMEDVLHSFIAENKPIQELAYEDFKQVKTEELKAMVSVDSMLNWNEHDIENKTKEAKQVYGLMAGFESDFAVHVGGVNPAAAEFSMMRISPK